MKIQKRSFFVIFLTRAMRQSVTGCVFRGFPINDLGAESFPPCGVRQCGGGGRSGGDGGARAIGVVVEAPRACGSQFELDLSRESTALILFIPCSSSVATLRVPIIGAQLWDQPSHLRSVFACFPTQLDFVESITWKSSVYPKNSCSRGEGSKKRCHFRQGAPISSLAVHTCGAKRVA